MPSNVRYVYGNLQRNAEEIDSMYGAVTIKSISLCPLNHPELPENILPSLSHICFCDILLFNFFFLNFTLAIDFFV